MGSGIGYSSSPPPNPEDEDWGEGYFDIQIAGKKLTRFAKRYLGGIACGSSRDNEYELKVLDNIGTDAYAFSRSVAAAGRREFVGVRIKDDSDSTVYVLRGYKIGVDKDLGFCADSRNLIDPASGEIRGALEAGQSGRIAAIETGIIEIEVLEPELTMWEDGQPNWERAPYPFNPNEEPYPISWIWTFEDQMRTFLESRKER